MTSSLPTLTPASTALVRRFEERYGVAPRALVRAPGRINLIGEHTDYNALPVLPCAIQREIRVALRAREDSRIVLHNVQPRFGVREFELAPEITPYAQADWGNYAKAAAQSVAREYGADRGFDALIDSDLPAASGLSSSSALLVACGLAVAHVHNVPIERTQFAERMARAEWYVGTNSGGMDQAVCLLGRAGHALRIDFDPLRSLALTLPPTWRFVIAHSLVFADKSGAARETYNRRRAECAAALEGLVGPFELPLSYPRVLRQLGAERAGWLGVQRLSGDLLRRFRHQLSEATRVELAQRALEAADPRWFGQLMDESHASLADDFEVSHPELDELTRIARAHGAFGARLTGAGFGGCIIALAHERDVDRLVRGLRAEFYDQRAPSPAVEEPILVATASEGASVFELG